MNITSYIFRIALFVLSAIFLPSHLVQGQTNPLQLMEGADDLRIDEKTGIYALRRNVRFVKDDTKMFCDSLFYNSRKKSLRAYGNVNINKQDTLNLFCDSLYYELDTEFAKLWGNVRVRDNEYKLVTDSLDFYGKENRGVYRRNGEITSILSPEKLTSKVGYFYTEDKNFFFRGDVVYTNEGYKITTDTLKFNGRSKKAYFFGPTNIYGEDGKMYCEKGWYDTQREEGVLQQNAYIDRPKEFIAGDSLYYDKQRGLSIGKGNVLIRDTTHQIEFTGDYAWSNELEHYAYITGHALAKRFENKDDTLYIHADTLYNYLDSLNEPKLVLGYHGVKLFKSDMQGVCDSLSYDRVNGEMNMYIDPVLWAKNAQVSGDTVSFYEKDGDIRRAFLRYQAMTITEVDTGKFYNQIAGKSMNAYFDSTEIRRVDIEGNAKTIYFMEDEEESDSMIVVNRSGMNRIYASSLSLYFNKGEVKGASYRDAPDGVLYPMDKIKTEEKLVEGFKWDNTRRPLSWQTMIMTPVEFERWEEEQAERKELLRPTALVLKDSLSMERVQRSLSIVQTYRDTNEVVLLQKMEADTSVTAKIKEKWEKTHPVIVQQRNELLHIIHLWENELLKLVFKQSFIAVRDTASGQVLVLQPWQDTKWKEITRLTEVSNIPDTLLKVGEQLDPHIGKYKESILSAFPAYEASLAELTAWRATRDSLQFALEEFALKDSLHTDSIDQAELMENSQLLDSLVVDSLELNRQTELNERWNEFQSQPQPKLSKNEKKAQRIDELFTYAVMEKEVSVSAYLLEVAESDISKLLLYLEALKVDVINAERELYLYFNQLVQQKEKKK